MYQDYNMELRHLYKLSEKIQHNIKNENLPSEVVDKMEDKTGWKRNSLMHKTTAY